MPPRAVWKGYLKIGELQCGVALTAAVSTADRIAFHKINHKTGHRLHRQFVDVDTGKAVPHDDQVKGYDTGDGRYVVLEPDEMAAVLPENTKTLAVDQFLPCTEIDTLYLDRPYFLTASDAVSAPVLALIRDGLKTRKVAALATALLFRRVRTLLIRVHDDVLIATLLKFDSEVRSAREAFAPLKPITITDEMLDLAKHIIKTKAGRFDPTAFDDRYEGAVAEMVRAKMEGRALPKRPAPAESKPTDLLAALRESARAGKAGAGSRTAQKGKAPRKSGTAKTTEPAPRRKAG